MLLWLKSEDDSIMSVCALVSAQKTTKPHNHDVCSAQKKTKIKPWLDLAVAWLLRLYINPLLHISCYNSGHQKPNLGPKSLWISGHVLLLFMYL